MRLLREKRLRSHGQLSVLACFASLFIFMLFLTFTVSANDVIAAAEQSNGPSAGSHISATTKSSKLKSLQSPSAAQNNQRLLVKFRSSGGVSAQSKLSGRFGAKVQYRSKSVPGLRVVEIPESVTASEALQAYRADPAVEFAEPDQRLSLRLLPDDPDFGKLWGLHNIGQDGGSNDADINAPEAWDITQGSDTVVVAVLDTGIDYTHVDLVDNMWVNPGEIPNNNIDDDGNGVVDDIYGYDSGDDDSDPMDADEHGTHVAGTIGARGNNTEGVSGVNWNVKIIACKIFGENQDELAAFVSDAIECLDYLYDLKTNRGIDIVATNNSWGWLGNRSQALFEAIERQAEAGILFIASSGNDSLDTDYARDFPSTYYLPNLISVAASDRNDQLADFSNTGKRSVHVTAPGVDVYSTVPGLLFNTNPHDEIFLDGAEAGRGGWTSTGSWNVTDEDAYNGDSSWTDSPNDFYANSSSSTLVSPLLDLSATGGTAFLGFFAKVELEPGGDELFIEVSPNNGGSWHTLETISTLSAGWIFHSIDIPAVHHSASFRFRFRLVTNDAFAFDGVYLDDIGVGTSPVPVTGSNAIASLDGTSMSSPHVTGVAALLKAQNGARDWRAIKNLIISSGTPLAELTDTTISGRRLRAADADNTGALTCSNQAVQGRLKPLSDTLFIESGDLINVAMLNINCEAPAGPLSVTVQETATTVDLLDNGAGFDAASGDGIYSAQVDIQASALRTATINYPDASSLNVSVVENYPTVVRAPSDWCEISTSGQSLDVGDDVVDTVTSPFPIPFANIENAFRKLAITTNGTVSLQHLNDNSTIVPLYENESLPTVSFQNLVAPYWDDLTAFDFGGNRVGSMRWGVFGSAPNRRLVVEWSNFLHITSSNRNGISFQAVFFENSTGVMFNYRDVTFGNSGLSGGAQATVGVQVASTAAQQFSFDTASLSRGTSLFWSLNGEAIPGRCLPTADDIFLTENSDGASLGPWGILALVLLLAMRRMRKRFL